MHLYAEDLEEEIRQSIAIMKIDPTARCGNCGWLLIPQSKASPYCSSRSITVMADLAPCGLWRLAQN